MVVDAAVVGLPRHRRVGDRDDRRRQAGGRGRRRSSAPDPAAAGPAAVDVRRAAAALRARRRRGPAGRCRRNRARRDRRPPRRRGRSPPRDIADAARCRRRIPPPGRDPTGAPNCATFCSRGDPAIARCTRIGRADRDASGIQIVAHHHDTKCLVGQAYRPGPRTAYRRRTAAGPSPARGWSAAGSTGWSHAHPTGCRRAPAAARRGWCPTVWVANGAPGTTSTRPAVGAPVLCAAEPVGGVVPVPRYRAERAGRGDPTGPGQRGR